MFCGATIGQLEGGNLIKVGGGAPPGIMPMSFMIKVVKNMCGTFDITSPTTVPAPHCD